MFVGNKILILLNLKGNCFIVLRRKIENYTLKIIVISICVADVVYKVLNLIINGSLIFDC